MSPIHPACDLRSSPLCGASEHCGSACSSPSLALADASQFGRTRCRRLSRPTDMPNAAVHVASELLSQLEWMVRAARALLWSATPVSITPSDVVAIHREHLDVQGGDEQAVVGASLLTLERDVVELCDVCTWESQPALVIASR